MHLELIKVHLSVTKGLESQLPLKDSTSYGTFLAVFGDWLHKIWEGREGREGKGKRGEESRGEETERQRDIKRDCDLWLRLIYGIKIQTCHAQVWGTIPRPSQPTQSSVGIPRMLQNFGEVLFTFYLLMEMWKSISSTKLNLTMAASV